MKHYLLLSTLLSGAIIAHSQITITNGDMPKAGDSIRYSIDFLPDNVPYDTSGTGITWDFSLLEPQSQGVYEYKFGLFINPVYSGFFGLTSFGLKISDQINLGVVRFDDVYNFYKTTSSAFNAEGFGVEINGVPVPADYSVADKVYQFPLKYGDYDSSNFRLKFKPTPDISFVRKGTRYNEVEGYGTVITPYGSFECLKVKVTVKQTDSIATSQVPFPVQNTQTTINYVWLSKQEKIPIVEVFGNVIPFVGYQVTQLRYRDKYRELRPTAVDEIEGESLSLFPNPFNSSLNVRLNESADISIWDVSGNCVWQQRQFNGGAINTTLFLSGLYVVKIENAHTRKVLRIVKQ